MMTSYEACIYNCYSIYSTYDCELCHEDGACCVNCPICEEKDYGDYEEGDEEE